MTNKKKGFVIVLEGCDKVGKSTVAAQLSQLLSWPVLKFGQPGPDGAFKEYCYALAHQDGPFIADRFHIGESVYGPIYRGAGMNQFDARHIENELRERGCLLVLMEDAPERIIARFKEHDETFAKEEHVRAIISHFDELFWRSRLPKIRASLHQHLATNIGNIYFHMTWRERQQ